MKIVSCIMASFAINALGFAVKVIAQGWKDGAME
jgi:hypothetical protein